jgi:hypothetical protein
MVLQFWKLASLRSLLNMQMLVRMVGARKSGGRRECEGRGRILSKEEKWYKVVKPRVSSVCMVKAAGGCVCLTEQSFSKFIIPGV